MNVIEAEHLSVLIFNSIDKEHQKKEFEDQCRKALDTSLEQMIDQSFKCLVMG
jgi:hypothetical protein